MGSVAEETRAGGSAWDGMSQASEQRDVEDYFDTKINGRNGEGLTPLMRILLGKVMDSEEELKSWARFLVYKKNLRVDMMDTNKNTYLHLVATSPYAELIPDLLDRGLTQMVDAENDQGKTALHLAIESGNEEAIRTLVGGGANKGKRGERGRSYMHLAVLVNAQIIPLLLELGFSLDTRDQDGRYPLALAIENNQPVAITHLVDGGANVRMRVAGGTYLHWVLETPHTVLIPVLLSGGMDELLEEKDDRGRTPLYKAEELGKRVAVDSLLTGGANPAERDRGLTNRKNLEEKRRRDEEAETKRKAEQDRLREEQEARRKAEQEQRRKEEVEQQAKLRAEREERQETEREEKAARRAKKIRRRKMGVGLFLVVGTTVGGWLGARRWPSGYNLDEGPCWDQYGDFCVDQATDAEFESWCGTPSVSSAKELYQDSTGAREFCANIQRFSNDTFEGFNDQNRLVTFAKTNNNTSLFRLKLPYVIGPPDMSIFETFFTLVESGQTEKLKVLISEFGNAPNVILKKSLLGCGHSLLSTASSLGHTEIVKVLLQNGIYVNTYYESNHCDTSKKGYTRTPIMLAAQNGHIETVAVLLEYGALDCTFNGDSAESLARDNGHSAVVNLLRSHTTDVTPTDNFFLGSCKPFKPYNTDSTP